MLKISENTRKSPGDLGRLAITQTSIKEKQLILVRKPIITIRGLKKLSNMKVTVILIVTGALGTVLKSLEKE